MFHVKPLNKLLTTCILKLRSLFLHVSIYSRYWLCVERSLYSLRAMN